MKLSKQLKVLVIWWNQMKANVLKISIITIICFTVFSLILNIFLYQAHIRKVNETVINIIAIVKQKYPDITDEEILNILNNKNYDYDLTKYGISKNDLYMLENTKSSYSLFLIGNLSITLIIGISLFCLLLFYIKKQKAKVEDLTFYIKELNKRNYSLRLTENSEDEISLLQNELYKITVLLKEQSENALKDKLSIKDAMSDISHQLKTPLTGIMIALDNIIESPKMDDKIKEEFLTDIKRQTENIDFLVSSILKLSRFDANVVKFTKQNIKIRDLIKDVLKNLDSMIKTKKVIIEVNGEEDISFKGDYKWQLEALTNIIKNGIESLTEKGIMKISYRKLSIYTEVTIEDNGLGINSKDLKHIFERFYKGEKSSPNSIGIGLSLAKKIIEQDNGYITVKKANKGTKFIIKYMK